MCPTKRRSFALLVLYGFEGANGERAALDGEQGSIAPQRSKTTIANESGERYLLCAMYFQKSTLKTA